MEIAFPGSITECAWLNTLWTLFPINRDDPVGIILSNFILALAVLNNSVTRPPSFHLPFICHPSFMAFVKLKRSWFSCGTIFTSQVSLAMDSYLCLQMTSNFPLWVQPMLCPFPIITDPFMGNKLYSQCIACHVTGAAESSMKSFFTRFDSAISLVTRAFSFSPFFFEYRDDIMVFSLFSRSACFPAFFLSILV